MSYIAEAASRRNPVLGLDHSRLYRPEPVDMTGLSRGGAVIFQLTRRAPATCNAMAELAGIGQEVTK